VPEEWMRISTANHADAYRHYYNGYQW